MTQRDPNPFQTPQTVEPSTIESQADWRAIAALVLGTLSWVLWCCPLVGLPISGLACWWAWSSFRRNGNGAAVAGLIVAAPPLVFSIGYGVVLALGLVFG